VAHRSVQLTIQTNADLEARKTLMRLSFSSKVEPITTTATTVHCMRIIGCTSLLYLQLPHHNLIIFVTNKRKCYSSEKFHFSELNKAVGPVNRC